MPLIVTECQEILDCFIGIGNLTRFDTTESSSEQEENTIDYDDYSKGNRGGNDIR